MRKSNWIIAAVFVLASILFLWMWHALQFDLVDNPLDLVVTIVWWVVIAGVCVAIHLAERKRRERVRTVFLASGLMYNSEAGMVRLEPGTPVVEALRNLLSQLEYDFDLAEPPSNSRVHFQRIVRSAKFNDDGDTWEGEVVEVAYPDTPRSFRSKNELATLVEG